MRNCVNRDSSGFQATGFMAVTLQHSTEWLPFTSVSWCDQMGRKERRRKGRKKGSKGRQKEGKKKEGEKTEMKAGRKKEGKDGRKEERKEGKK